MTVKAKIKRPIFDPRSPLGNLIEIYSLDEVLTGKIEDGFFYGDGKGGVGITVDWIEIIIGVAVI